MASGDVNNHTTLSIYINELKSSISSWEDMTFKSQKLNSNLKISGQNINSIFDSLSSLCKIRDGTNYSGMEKIESIINDLSIREKYFSDKILLFNNVIENNFVVNLSLHIENWKKSINALKKEREFDGKKAKLDYKKALMELSKLESKVCKRTANKKSLSDNITLQIDYAHQNLQNKMKFLEELERCSLKKAVYEERCRFKQFLECLRPVLDAQLSMKSDLDELQVTYDKLYSSDIDDLATVPPDIDALIKQYSPIDASGRDSISSLYSRANSQVSLSSSYCSSQDPGFQLPGYYYGAPQTLPNPECSLTPNDVDVSSSTIRELNLISPPESITEQDDDDNSDRDSLSNDDHQYTRNWDENDSQSKDPAFLYPNQVMPPPPYSNLRELKQNADKKYGVPVVQRDQETWNNHNHMPTTRSCSLNNETNSGFYRGQYDYLPYVMPSADNNGYAALVSVTNSTPFTSIASGVSTFKRRKPSTTITAMETPNIFDKCSFDDTHLGKNTRSYSVDRGNNDLSHMSTGVENMFLESRTSSAISGRMSVSQIYPTSKPVHSDSDYNLWTAKQQKEVPDNLKNTNNINSNLQFKQQLLKVIQGDRYPYRKSSSPLSNQIL